MDYGFERWTELMTTPIIVQTEVEHGRLISHVCQHVDQIYIVFQDERLIFARFVIFVSR